MKAKGKYSEYRETEVTQVGDILKILRDHPSLQFFRGQSDARWTLVPKISRLYKKGKIPDTWPRLESFILSDFRKYAVINIDREPKNKFEWMVRGQHHGLPTRLLDWSTNPLKAAYFAVNEYSKGRDGALFAFSPDAVVPRFEDDEDIDIFKHLMPIFPNMIDNRIVAQEACFTVFPHAQDYRPFRPLEDITSYDGSYHLMLKMIIPRDWKDTFLHDLNLLGVNSRTLFPDLEGLTEFISWDHERRRI